MKKTNLIPSSCKPHYHLLALEYTRCLIASLPLFIFQRLDTSPSYSYSTTTTTSCYIIILASSLQTASSFLIALVAFWSAVRGG